MSTPGAPSWQITLADLSLILFTIMATTGQGSPRARPHQPALTASVAPPVAVIRRPDELGRWLRQQPRDPRLRLTITATHADGGRDAALTQAAQMAETALRHGMPARILVEPAAHSELIVTLAFDQPAGTPPQVSQASRIAP